MKVNLKTILPVLGVSFCMLISLSVSAAGQTWYDSEGRPLSMKDGKVIRGNASVDKKEEKIATPIIPKSLELRPELSTVQSQRIYHYPYTRNHYGYYGYNRSNSYHQGCYRPSYRSSARGNVYLNYRRGGLSIRARF